MDSPAPPARHRFALPATVLTVGILMNMLSRGLIETFAVFLLPLGEFFKADRASLTVIYSTYMLVYGLSAPLMGYLIDRIGVRVCYLVGLLLLGSGFWFAGSATELWHLYLLLGVACGAGAAALGMVPASVLASYWFDRRLPSAMSVLYASLGMGVLLFSPLSQWLIESRGLQAAYRSLALAPLFLLPLIVLLPWKQILVGDSTLRARRESAVRKGVKTALLQALHQSSFWKLAGVMFFTTLATFTIMIQLVAYLIESGFDALLSATVFGLLGMISTVGMMYSGWLAEKHGEKTVATASYLCTIGGVGLLALLDAWPSMTLLVGFVILFGTVSGSRGPLVAVLASRLFAGDAQATIYGTVLLAMGVGGALAGWATGALHDVTGGYHAGFALSALAAMGGLVTFRSIDTSQVPRRAAANG